ncbi:MAG: HPr family phosphocarrier protein [Planctomycetota bacterium]|nr:HPr family phosphocarrier protein [Planctomycetota bacterium]
MSTEKISLTVTVLNPQGLHARPADLIVRLASQFASMIEIGKQGEWADAKSILSLLTLGAAQGTELKLQATGSDASAAIKAIGELFAQGFNEMGAPIDA